MSVSPLTWDRKMVPRWRSAAASAATGELQPLRTETRSPVPPPDRAELELRIDEWRSTRTVSFAADLVGVALVLDEYEAGRDAAEFLLQTETPATELARSLAAHLLEPEQQQLAFPEAAGTTDDLTRFRARIRDLRARTRLDPRDVLAWVDLAHMYVSLGLADKAVHALQAPLALAPDNRFVLRSATRLHVHRDEPERAHAVLLSSDRTSQDPWLLAAEIAVADLTGERSRFVRRGRAMLESGSHAPLHTAELAGSIATLELEAGKLRLARQLFRAGLVEPTENTVAQVEWANSKSAQPVVERVQLDIASAFEARALHAISKGEWEDAIDESWNWLRDERFSPAPGIVGSYVAAMGARDFASSAAIAQAGLFANPKNQTLRNNLAFALINMGYTPGAATHLDMIRPPWDTDQTEETVLATRGLLAYRTGDTALGRARYEEAVRMGLAKGDRRWLALASMLFAREEALASAPGALDAIKRAVAIADEVPFPEVQVLKNELEAFLVGPNIP